MNTLPRALQATLRFVMVGVLVVAAIAGLFVAWWIVVCAVFALSAYIAIRRFFGVAPPGPGVPPGSAGTVIIEGEYEVERNGGKSGGRVIEVRPDDPPRGGA